MPSRVIFKFIAAETLRAVFAFMYTQKYSFTTLLKSKWRVAVRLLGVMVKVLALGLRPIFTTFLVLANNSFALQFPHLQNGAYKRT